MVEHQYCFEIKEVGKNLNKDHPVFNLLYLVAIFEEFYPEFFAKKIKVGQRIKYHPKDFINLCSLG